MGNRTEIHPLGGGNKDAYDKNQIICEIDNPAASQTSEVDMPKKVFWHCGSSAAAILISGAISAAMRPAAAPDSSANYILIKNAIYV